MLGWAMRIKARFDEDKIWILKTNGSQICDKDISYTYIGQSQDMKRSVDKLLRTKIGNQHPEEINASLKMPSPRVTRAMNTPSQNGEPSLEYKR